MAVTWDSLHAAACNAIQSQIEAATVTWDDCMNSPDMWRMNVLSTGEWWKWAGKPEKAIMAEAKRRYLESLKGDDDE